MVSFPLYILLFIYLFFLLAFTGFFLVNIGNLVRTGTFTFVSFFVTFIFLAIAALALFATMLLLRGVNWQTPVVIWNSAWSSPPLN